MKTLLLYVSFLIIWTVSFSQNWANVGTPGFSDDWSYNQVLKFDNQTAYVAYKDYGQNESVVVKKFDGTNWIQVGTSASSDNIDYFSFDIHDGELYVAFDDSENSRKLTVRKYDGTNWVNVGSTGFSVDQIYYPSIAFDADSIYVAYLDDLEFLSVQKFDGTNWNSAASMLTNANVGYLKLKISNSDKYILYHEYENNTNVTRVLAYDGQSWTHLPDITTSTSSTSAKDMDVDNGYLYIAMVENTGNGTFFRVDKFNGTNWELQGANGVTDSLPNYLSMTVEQGVPYVAYKEVSSSNLMVKKFNGNTWEFIGSTARKCFHTAIEIDPVTSQPMVAFSDVDNGEKTSVILFDSQSGLLEESKNNWVSVYPNPVVNILKINAPSLSVQNVYVFDTSGKVVLKGGNVDKVDVSSLESGTYFISIIFDSHEAVSSFIKE